MHFLHAKPWIPVGEKQNGRYIADDIFKCIFLHAKPCIPVGEESIFTVIIHQWGPPLRQFTHLRTIDEYNVTMSVPRVRMTSQINCDDVKMLIRKRPSLALMAKWAIDDFL